MERVGALQEKARQIRIDTLDMILSSGSGHIGGSYSANDILVALYYDVMKISKDPADPDRDRFVLSKGHANPALYAILMDVGYVPKTAKNTLRQFGSPFQGHPDSAVCPGIDCTTGSLGQGITVGVGMALGLKKQHRSQRVFVVTGDGELNEGVCWEAFMAASNFELDNLTIIIDRNMIQLGNNTEKLMKLGDLRGKMESFGFMVDEIDGHDFNALLPALEKKTVGKPHCIIARTVKGKGVSYMENNVAWHGGVPKGDQIAQAYAELGGTYNG